MFTYIIAFIVGMVISHYKDNLLGLFRRTEKKIKTVIDDIAQD